MCPVQMAFLTAMVGPKVAAAAAQAALESLTAEDPSIGHEAAAGMANGPQQPGEDMLVCVLPPCDVHPIMHLSRAWS